MGSMAYFRPYLLALMLLVAPMAQAAMIQFQGTITSVTGGFSPLFAPGQTLVGFIVLTSGSSDFDANPNVGLYETAGGGIVVNFSNGDSQSVDGFSDPFIVQVNTAVATDQTLETFSTMASGLTLELLLRGGSGFLASDAFPAGVNSPNLAAFLLGEGYMFDQASIDLKGEEGDSLRFSITGVSEVPEPSTYLLTGFGIVMLAWRRRR
jgi:hypothetical protein